MAYEFGLGCIITSEHSHCRLTRLPFFQESETYVNDRWRLPAQTSDFHCLQQGSVILLRLIRI